MSRLVAVAIAAVLLYAACAFDGRASSTGQLRQQERQLVRKIERAKTTLRWFEHHPRVLYSRDPRARRAAWHAVAVARQHVIQWREKLGYVRSEIDAAKLPPHYAEWRCIQRHETPPPFPGWKTNSGNGYYGGLQMDREFMATYGARLYRAKGTADRWTPAEQMWVAERALRTRGFWPWPRTARACGLL